MAAGSARIGRPVLSSADGLAATQVIVAAATLPATSTWLGNLVYGAGAGITGTSLMYPVDQVKTLMMSGKFATPWSCVKHLLGRGGVPAFYRGLGSYLLFVTPEKAIKLSVNTTVRSHFEQAHVAAGRSATITIGEGVLAGAAAGFAQVVVTTPMEQIKIENMIAGSKGMPKESLQGMIARLGMRGLYGGYVPTLLRDVCFSVCYFPVYEVLRHRLAGHESGPVPFSINLLSATLVSGTAAWVVTPLDVAKTRLQQQVSSVVKEDRVPYRGVVDCLRRIAHEEGASRLFCGASMRVLSIAPMFGMVMAVYELKTYLEERGWVL
jgi:hypothetical protein